MKSNMALIGKNKKEIITILGDEFNADFCKTWSYKIKTSWFKSVYLYLEFDENDFVAKAYRKTKYFF
ncbi:hypothetical protein ASG31_10370 [Chryseobacterium sp. Leaf404]|nr:hypothetical protein ASG31_10370 [Chryseobacterium sp. Leaf404]